MNLERMLKAAFGDTTKMRFRADPDVEHGVMVGCVCGGDIAAINPTSDVGENILKIVIHTTADCPPPTGTAYEDEHPVSWNERKHRKNLILDLSIKWLCEELGLVCPKAIGSPGAQALRTGRDVVLDLWMKGDLSEELEPEDFFVSATELGIADFGTCLHIIEEFDLSGALVHPANMSSVSEIIQGVLHDHIMEFMARLTRALYDPGRLNKF